MDNIITIVLQRASERYAFMTKQFKERNINSYIYDALDAQDFSNPTFVPKLSLKGGYRYNENFQPGEIGCILSHIGAIKMAKALKLPYVLILEDDVILSEDFKERFDKMLKLTPPNWEHILLSAHTFKRPGPIISPCVLPVTDRVMGAYSYVLKYEAYDKAIKTLSSLQSTTDDLLERLILGKQLKSYIWYPFLTTPNVEDSYIWNKTGDKQSIHDSLRLFKNKL